MTKEIIQKFFSEKSLDFDIYRHYSEVYLCVNVCVHARVLRHVKFEKLWFPGHSLEYILSSFAFVSSNFSKCSYLLISEIKKWLRIEYENGAWCQISHFIQLQPLIMLGIDIFLLRLIQHFSFLFALPISRRTVVANEAKV